LYVTGTFSNCGLNPSGYQQSGLLRGRVPTSKIAVIDLSQDPSVRSWRPLGIGLVGGTCGSAMTYYSGQLYVGGTFNSAGGVLNSNGIASWNGKKWNPVVSNCRGICDRPNNVYPFMSPSQQIVPPPNIRKPAICYALATIGGLVYCIDNLNRLDTWDGSTWRQTGTLSVYCASSNVVIINNGSNSNNVLVPATSVFDANGYNLGSWSSTNQQFEPSFGGFSTKTQAFAGSSIVVLSQFILFSCIFLSFISILNNFFF